MGKVLTPALEVLKDVIVSRGSVPREVRISSEDYFSTKEILRIENYAASHSDEKLKKFIDKIYEENGNG